MTTTAPISSAEISQLLEEQQSSKLSVAEFARQRGVAAHRLYWARKKARETSSEAKRDVAVTEFSQVVLQDGAAGQTTPLEIRLPSGIVIVVTRDFDEVALRRLLGLLAPC